MRYNRTRPESRINTGFSLISSKRSAGKSTGGEDNFRSLGGERRPLRKREKKGELVKIRCTCKMKVDTHKSVGVCFFMVR